MSILALLALCVMIIVQLVVVDLARGRGVPFSCPGSRFSQGKALRLSHCVSPNWVALVGLTVPRPIATSLIHGGVGAL